MYLLLLLSINQKKHWKVHRRIHKIRVNVYVPDEESIRDTRTQEEIQADTAENVARMKIAFENAKHPAHE